MGARTLPQLVGDTIGSDVLAEPRASTSQLVSSLLPSPGQGAPCPHPQTQTQAHTHLPRGPQVALGQGRPAAAQVKPSCSAGSPGESWALVPWHSPRS